MQTALVHCLSRQLALAIEDEAAGKSIGVETSHGLATGIEQYAHGVA